MRKILLITLLASIGLSQSSADRKAIEAAAMDYLEGWYSGDAVRMERALHPELAKRMVYFDDKGRSRLNTMGSLTLIQKTRNGGGKTTPKDKIVNRAKILDVYGNTASVRADATGWIDYLHIVKWNGEWKIINVLWELRPEE